MISNIVLILYLPGCSQVQYSHEFITDPSHSPQSELVQATRCKSLLISAAFQYVPVQNPAQDPPQPSPWTVVILNPLHGFVSRSIDSQRLLQSSRVIGYTYPLFSGLHSLRSRLKKLSTKYWVRQYPGSFSHLASSAGSGKEMFDFRY